MTWKKLAEKDKELAIVTCLKNQPHMIVAISHGFVDGQLLFSICQSKTTLKNLAKNDNIVIYLNDKKEYYRLRGKAQLHACGKYLDMSRELDEGPKAECAVLVKITDVFDLDRVKKIDL